MVLGVSVFQKSVAQSVVHQYPLEVSQFFSILTLSNPALQNKEDKWQATAFSKAYTGLLKNNNLSLFNVSTRITPKKSKSYHNVGAILYYDKEGSYLNRYRVYINYAYSLRLNDTWTTSLGASIGAMSYRVGNENFPGGQDNTMDGNIGLALFSQRWAFGLSILQIPQGQVQPIIERSLLQRYYAAYAQRSFDLSAKSRLLADLNTTVFGTQQPWLNARCSWEYDGLVSLGMLYKWNKSLGLIFGLEKIKLGENQLRLYLSYDVNISKSYKNNSVEVSLKFSCPQVQKKVTHKQK